MNSSQDNSTRIGGRRKKQAPGFIHDSNARNDQKILRLRAKGGWAWYGLYFACVEIMREDADLGIDLAAVDAIALSLAVTEEELAKFLKATVEIGLFVLTPDGRYQSDSLVERMQRYEDEVEQRRNAGKASAEARAQRKLNENPTAVAAPFNAPNLIQSNLIQSNLSEGSGEVQEGVPFVPPPATHDDPATWTPFRKEAEDALEPVTAEIARAPGFVGLQRRPMKKYPELWLTGPELATVTERILEAGITIADRPRVFTKASAHAKKQKSGGREASLMNAFGWLTGFALTQTIEEITKSNQMATSSEYLKKARSK